MIKAPPRSVFGSAGSPVQINVLGSEWYEFHLCTLTQSTCARFYSDLENENQFHNDNFIFGLCVKSARFAFTF